MRRDYLTVDIDPDPSDAIPTMAIDYDGPSGGLRDRLTSTADATFESGELDVAFRRQRGEDAGVLSLTDRLTGEFILEVTVPEPELARLVDAAQDTDTDGEYAVRLTDSEGKSLVYEKRTLLVYDHDGGLLRQRSLIPGSVEL